MNYNKDSIIQSCNFIKKRLHHRCFPVIRNTYFEKYLRPAASENLSDAAILIFRRYFWSSCRSGFYAGVTFQSSCWPLAWNFIKLKDCIMDIFQWFLQSFYFKNTFLQNTSVRLNWYLENFTLKILILNKFVHSINIVDTLYFMSTNLDLVKT